jgi:hypothetical protein
MVGSKRTLAIEGDTQDDYFTVKPDITFFKGVFKRHTRFAIETISQSFDKQSIHAVNETVLSLTGTNGIKRSGDLLKSMYFTFTLPDIYSGSVDGTRNIHFKWIRNLGYYIIKTVKLRIGKNIIQDFTGEWLDIHKELYLNDEEKKSIDKMIGNTVDMTAPEKADGNIIQEYVTIAGEQIYARQEQYPHAKLLPDSNAVATLESVNPVSVNVEDSITDKVIPSIRGRKIRVPLSFWFTKASSQALPLIALEDSPIEIEIRLRPLNDLYTVSEANNSGVDGNSLLYRIKNNNTTIFEHSKIQYFLKDNDPIKINYDGAVKSLTNNNMIINPEIESTYIFLDNDERKIFKQNNHQYLIETVKTIETTNIRTTQKTIETNSNNHVKDIIVVPKRTDSTNVNEWDNFTNWLQKDVSPTSYQYWKSTSFNRPYYDTTVGKYPFPSRQYTTNTFFRKQYLQKDIIQNMDILFNKTQLFKTQTATYFQNQQVLEYFKTNPKDGIYVYTFSLNPTNPIQPSGSLNCANQDVSVRINFQPLPIQGSYPAGNESNYVSDYGYDVNIYLVQYNILKIEGGTAGLQFET